MLLACIDDVPSTRPSSQVKEHLRPRTHHQTRHFAGGFRLRPSGPRLPALGVRGESGRGDAGLIPDGLAGGGAQCGDGGVDVAGVPQYDRVEDQAECAELVFLAFPIRLAQLAALAVEQLAGQPPGYDKQPTGTLPAGRAGRSVQAARNAPGLVLADHQAG